MLVNMQALSQVQNARYAKAAHIRSGTLLLASFAHQESTLPIMERTHLSTMMLAIARTVRVESSLVKDRQVALVAMLECIQVAMGKEAPPA